ncbi:hydroxyacylglutathione hydrolase [Lampropedia hyalina]|jgi:hydroxyacylglutathione hydrolase|uniref:hydroxyacylglutathione hydrolase n=1 Tax=Lampropedia hyalina TaxID=198706 RepID=UPI00093493A2|nr:hydroxyacylglutathione hydrolase [Lampropedia hyalina]
MNAKLQIQAVAALHDNYIWLLHDGQNALVIDPGEARPVLHALEQQNLALQAVLVTHHHHDHTGGIAALQQVFRNLAVYGPSRERLPVPFEGLAEGDVLDVLGVHFAVLDVPGHTQGHIAFHADCTGSNRERLDAPLLFCGDTLFSAGCGRLLEGSAEQMLHSLQKLMRLAPETLVYGGHEYTLENLRFALVVEPDNDASSNYLLHCRSLRDRGLPTLPSSLERELQVNPFLRIHWPSVRDRVSERFSSSMPYDDMAVFAALREWKNNF